MTELQNEKRLLKQSKKRLEEFKKLKAPEVIINNELKLIKVREDKIQELESNEDNNLLEN